MALASVRGSSYLALLFERWHDLCGKEFELFADNPLWCADNGPHVDLLQPRIALLKRLDFLNNRLRRSYEPGTSRHSLFERGEPGGARPSGIPQGHYLLIRETAHKSQWAKHFHVFLEIGARLLDGFLLSLSNVETVANDEISAQSRLASMAG